MTIIIEDSDREAVARLCREGRVWFPDRELEHLAKSFATHRLQERERAAKVALTANVDHDAAFIIAAAIRGQS